MQAAPRKLDVSPVMAVPAGPTSRPAAAAHKHVLTAVRATAEHQHAATDSSWPAPGRSRGWGKASAHTHAMGCTGGCTYNRYGSPKFLNRCCCQVLNLPRGCVRHAP
jgi:hypothetical protein